MSELKTISNLVKHQFPDFYRESGTEFILFLEAYYEWLEQQDNLVNQTRSLFEYIDIDTTPEAFLSHFKEKYMKGLPIEIIGNQRLFQKHILDLYRSKGSFAGLKLLFRLLYNEDVSIYIPSYNIFTASDGKWVQKKYIEVTYNEYINLYQGKVIRGSESGAKAVVENVLNFSHDSKRLFILYITHIQGTFIVGETLIPDDIDLNYDNMVRVLGSPNSASPITSSIGFDVGEILRTGTSENDIQAVVTEVVTRAGLMEFTIVDGGTYYTNNAIVSITTGSNTSGSGADFIISEISNTSLFEYCTDDLATFANVALNATAYGFVSDPTANSGDVIADCLDIQTIPAGTISKIQTTNPGSNYDGSVNVSIIDPITSTKMIADGNGGYGGNNAVVTGYASVGDGIVNKLKIISSGYSYNIDNQVFTFSNNTGNVTAVVDLGGVGYDAGAFDSTDSFPSADKYLFDGHYYQEYSYVVKSTKALDEYKDILQQIIHPAGNVLYSELLLDVVVSYASSKRDNDFVIQSDII